MEISTSKRLRKRNTFSQRRRIRKDILVCMWTLIFAYYYATSNAYPTTSIEESDHIHEDSEGEFKSLDSNGDAPLVPEDVPPEEVPDISDIEEDDELHKKWKNTIRKYAKFEVPGVNCTPPGIDDFPDDLFSQKQRQQGWVIIHFLVSLYIFVGLAVVCDDYFVPSMERICEELNLPSDVAGATFMAIATSAPELFTNIIGTFITKGDIGVGTIVGSAVFNILAVAAVCGIGAGMIVPLEWWSVSRDCFCYLFTVILLLIVLRDERIYWYEALVLVLVYLLYILVMYKNAYLKKRAEKLVGKTRRKLHKPQEKVETTYTPSSIGEPSEKDKLRDSNGDAQNGIKLTPQNEDSEGNEIEGNGDDSSDEAEVGPPFKMTQEEREQEEEEGLTGLCDFPHGEGFKAWLEFIVCFPCRLLFTFTIPDCRQERWKQWYPLTFAMCIVWIGTLSYIVNWMMTIIGHTLRIPDSVMGLTFIAAGTSVPEVVSSLIVARQGLGTMAVSNSIGSNTFDVLMCLGIPWLIRASMLIGDEVEDYIQINSHGLEYSTMMLITSLAILYAILAFNKFKLDKKVGYLSLLLYSAFLVFASLFELNVFFTVNLPTCQYHED